MIAVALSPSDPKLLQLAVIGPTVLGLVLGAVIIWLGRMLGQRPDRHRAAGVIVLLLGIASLELPPAGFLLGVLLAVFGGLLCIAGAPPAIVAAPAPGAGPLPLGPWNIGSGSPTLPTCPFCGHANPWGATECEQCESPLK